MGFLEEELNAVAKLKKKLGESASAPETKPGLVSHLNAGGERDQRSRPPAYAPWVVLALGVALAATGAGLGAHVLDSSVVYHDSTGPAAGSTACFVLAGTAAAAAGGLWLWRYLAGRKAAPTKVAASAGGFAVAF